MSMAAVGAAEFVVCRALDGRRRKRIHGFQELNAAESQFYELKIDGRKLSVPRAVCTPATARPQWWPQAFPSTLMADANSSSGGGGGKKAEFDPVTAAAAAAAAAEGPATAAGGRGGTTDGDDTGGAAAPAGAGNAAPGAAGASQSKPSAAPVGRGAAGHVRGDSKKGGWRRFVQPFYYVNALVVVSYLLVREWYPNARCRKITETFGMTRVRLRVLRSALCALVG